MRKTFWITSLFMIALAALFFLSASMIKAAADGLSLLSPSGCPSSGCAAGQRLNLLVEFTISPQTSDPNAQVCVYAPSDGQSGTGSETWANYSEGWISNSGILSNINYKQGQISTLCIDNTDAGEVWVTGAYATHSEQISDQLEFALHINATTDIDGNIKVKVFQADSDGVFGNTPSSNFSQAIPVAPKTKTVYVANSLSACGEYAPCYINSGDDLQTGLGTGLRDAIRAFDPNDEILILNAYAIKSNTVLVDKALTLHSQGNSVITYNGSQCNYPMLSMTAGGSLKDLTINDGNCSSPSRNLIEVSSPADVVIEHNTLQSGKRAVHIQDNSGDITVAFNQISENADYAVYKANQAVSGGLDIYANNILENGTGSQVNCNTRGTANHNFWGEGLSATDNAVNCGVSDGKQLGAPIVRSSSSAGVEAVRKNVTDTMTYAFNNKIGVRNSLGENFDVIIVNHGQGEENNIPFYPSGAEEIEACSNFYDVFLTQGAVASNLVLSLKYDLNSRCVNTIESIDYCSQPNRDLYPLWWFDPANDVTKGWDRTGQNPQGISAGGAIGQETSCDMSRDEILVTIDNTGRPGIADDLNFTPFVIGFPISQGVNLSQFDAAFNGNEIDLQWNTTNENNVQGFYVLRSNSESGTFSRISPQIEAMGDIYIGALYKFTDTDILNNSNYYYKIEVIDNDGVSMETHGPVSVLTSAPSPTVTITRTPTRTFTPYPTRTPYPTWTATPYYYRSPTSYYIRTTPTSSGGPTQVRTYGPSPTSAFTTGTASPTGSTATIDPNNGYPLEETTLQATSTDDAYPAPDGGQTPLASEGGATLTMTPTPQGAGGGDVPENELTTTKTIPPGSRDEYKPLMPQQVRWVYLLIGALSGLGLLAAASVFLAKSRFS